MIIAGKTNFVFSHKIKKYWLNRAFPNDCLIQKTKEVMQPRLINLLKNIMGHSQSFLGDKYELSRR